MKTLKIGKASKADKINYSIVFQPPAEWEDPNGDLVCYDEGYNNTLLSESLQDHDLAMSEYKEAREWLNQFYPCTSRTIETNRKILLIVGSETWVDQVWSMKNDNYKGVCYLEYINSESMGD